jgi:hypothetical protein
MVNRRFWSSALTACAAYACSLASFARPASAEEPADPVASEPAPPEAEESTPPPSTGMTPKPSPYSLPWQLRSVTPGNVLRLDSAFASYKNPASGQTGGTALATSILGSYKVIPNLAVIARLGLVRNSPPASPPPSATSFINPVVGGLYGIKLSPSLKLGLFLGFTLPIGTGGGDNPDPGKAAANSAGMATRSAMDNSMFAVNYFTVIPGIDFAFVQSGLTVQAEATLFKLTRARGPSTQDSTNTNLTAGLHVGYFILPMLSVGAELRHQRWLSTPASVKADKTNSIRDTSTFAIGPRFHFELSDDIWFRPGLALALPLDDPMKKSEYKIVQLDLPFSF